MNMLYKIVLKEGPLDRGLSQNDISFLLKKLGSEEVLPVEFQFKGSALDGFIDLEIAKILNYDYSSLECELRKIVEDEADPINEKQDFTITVGDPAVIFNALIARDCLPDTAQSYTIGVKGTLTESPRSWRVIGTKEQVAKYLLNLVVEDRQNDAENWISGTEDVGEVCADSLYGPTPGQLNAYGQYAEYSIDYSATLDNGPELLDDSVFEFPTFDEALSEMSAEQ